MSNYWADDQAAFMKAGEQTVGVFNREQAERYAKHMIEEVYETKDDFESCNYAKAVDGAVDTIVVAIGFLHSIGVNPDRAWDIVHAANMRKVINGKVYRRDDNQIGKPPGWHGPEKELSELVREVMI